LDRAPRPRPLHPLPTRRSSDLSNTDSSKASSRVVTRVTSEPSVSSARAANSDGPPGVHPPAGVRSSATLPATRLCVGAPLWLQRSEEHTSELQSRENLVCRLLL